MAKPAISQYPRSSKDHGGLLMGYSVRDERWRATFWRKRDGEEIGYTELYDEVNDPAETVNLAESSEHAELLARLVKYLPPVGSDARGPKSPKITRKTEPSSKRYDPNEPRDQRYDRLYPGKPKLTEDQYIAGQGGDKAAAKERFVKLDGDGDGFVTRDEFIGGGKKKKKP